MKDTDFTYDGKVCGRRICVKPPIGLEPRMYIVEKRIVNIIEAMDRYIQADKEIPMEWIQEYNELTKWHNKNK